MTSSRKGRLDASKVREIRGRFSVGAKAKDLAAEFGVSIVTISQVVRRKTWPDIEDSSSHMRRCPNCDHDLRDAIKLLGEQAYADHIRGCVDKKASS